MMDTTNKKSLNTYKENFSNKQNEKQSKSQVISVGRSFGGFSVNLQ
ncbi:hypothetical protein [Macrococcus sp. DPC7161]|nr:hypothetical protein [Macrococcus sp. DPC7161]